MSEDLALYNAAEAGLLANPTVRIYGWKNHCISLGHSQDPYKELHIDNCRNHDVEVVKRPTGGGIVLHDPNEITYSVVSLKSWMLDQGLIRSFSYISEAVIEGLKCLGIDAEMSNTRQKGFARYCNMFPATHEIVFEGKKLVGSAQKRGNRALLQQGSIMVYNGGIEPKHFIQGYTDDYGDKSTSIHKITGNMPTYKELKEAITEGFKRKFRVVMI
jgi:lipoate-protein ligase A